MSDSNLPARATESLEVRFVQPRPSDPRANFATLQIAIERLRQRNHRMARGLALGFRRVENESVAAAEKESES